MSNFMSSLNDEQIESVLICDQPLRIVAGAGSGKTRVITTKICYLISVKNIFPNRILAVTFTNKAANEMKERVRKMISLVQDPVISTFHALCTKILRIESDNCGLNKNFVIIDESFQLSIIRKILKELNIQIKSPKEAKKYLYPISDWKNNLVEPSEAIDKSYGPAEKNYANVYKMYEKHLEKNSYVDFDDLLLKVHRLFRENEAVRKKWSSRFDYILVDEFQDTNQIQFDIVCWLNDNRNTLTVVGDPDQTIYTWRGAEMRIIMDFDKKFVNSKTIKLITNYRSTKKILNLANNFIANNKDRIEKELVSHRDENFPIKLASASAASFEARYVTNQIKELVTEKGYKYSDIFVLYRINALSGNFERAFANSKIPFQVIGGLNFKDRKVIKDITAMLYCLVSEDNFYTTRVLKNIPKVGQVTIGKLEDLSNQKNVNILRLFLNFENEVRQVSKHFDEVIVNFKKAKKMYQENQNVLEIAKFLIQSFDYESSLKITDENYEDNKQHIKSFLDQMRDFDSNFDVNQYEIENRLEAFFQFDSLGIDSSSEHIENSVSLMTIHASKGLENKVVFIVGLNDGIFPSSRSYYSNDLLEEERRTLYVAITRAKETLYLTYINGEYSFLVNGNLHASRFINELDTSLFEQEHDIFFHTVNDMSSNKGPRPQFSAFAKSDIEIKPGDNINHIMFGDGVVTKVTPEGILVVAFNDSRWKVQSFPSKITGWKKI